MRRLRRAGRIGLAVVLAGVLAAMAWLIVMQQSHVEGWTTHEANAVIGELMGGEGPQVSRRGLHTTFAAGVLLAGLYALLLSATSRLPRLGHWALRGLATGLVVFLAWGLLLAPLAASRTDVPGGPFGLDAGWETLLIGLIGAAAGGITLARVYELVASDEWWEVKHFDLRESMEELFTEGVDGSGVRKDRVEVPDMDPGDHPPLRH